VERIELPAAKGRRLQRRDGTSRPYRHFPRTGRPSDQKVRGFSLTRLPPVHPRSAEIWRRTEVLIPTPEGAIPLRTGAGRPPG